MREAGVKGGVILFRGTGAAARRYVEADRSRADEYYLGAGESVAEYAVVDVSGEVIVERSLTAAEYEGWVNWVNPITGERMGTPRLPGEGRRGSPVFAEMVVNAPKSLSVAAALHPDVSDALDQAQQIAVAEIRRWLAQHSITRVGPRGAQEVVPIEHMQMVGIKHRTSRAGDPHRHIHLQIGTRVWAAAAWRALDTAALFKQQGAIRALGTAVVAAHPQLADTLARHGLTLDPVNGEVVELEPFNAVMSKRSAQIQRNLTRLEAEWEAEHPGQTPGPVVTARMQGAAWAHERPGKKPTDLRDEAWWTQELRDAGYDPATLRRLAHRAPVALHELSVQQVASRALDRCAAGASAWTPHTVQEHVTRITTEAGIRATPAELREFITIATQLAVQDCFSILSPDTPAPDHVAHLTSLRVIEADTALRDLLHVRVPEQESEYPDVTEAAQVAGLDGDQSRAGAAVASTDPLVVVEGAAGAGKTTMLGVAIDVAREHVRATRVVAPTLRAARVAGQELGVPATSVAALVHAHGFRWNSDGVWTRLTAGDVDPDTGRVYTGPPRDAALLRGERVIVDEAGMLDQDTAIALLTATAEAGASVALVGDRAQLPAVGRGGVLDLAALIRGRTYDMAGVHRFSDPAYADLTLRMRDGHDPGYVFDQLADLGLIQLHVDDDTMREHIATETGQGEAITAATNEEAAAFNERIRIERIERGEVDDVRTVTGSDGLSIGAGDVIQTRQNDTRLRVANRQSWIVQHIADDGTLYAKETGIGRKRRHTVALPADYVGEHVHLSYAATAYGVQGATVAGSHTTLSDALSAAGVYVGMTRGRDTNQLHVVAGSPAEARAQFIEAMQRDRADRGLVHATHAAHEAVRGLTDDGPVKVVATELARLDHEAERAERATQRWERIAERLDAQRATHRAENDDDTDVLHAAEEHAARIRSEVAAPLIAQAEAHGTAYLAALAREDATRTRLTTAGRFGRRRARAQHRSATMQTRSARERVRAAWGEPPRNTETLTTWAAEQATRRAESYPRVIAAAQAVETAKTAQKTTHERHKREHLALLVTEYGAERAHHDQARARLTNPHGEARNAHAQAATGSPPGRRTPYPPARRSRHTHRSQVRRRGRSASARSGASTTTPCPPPARHQPHGPISRPARTRPVGTECRRTET